MPMRRPASQFGPDPIDTHVGARIRARRIGMRVSQTNLGRAIGVTFQQVQKYETGTNRVGASNLLRIARALGVEVAYFFEGAPDSPDPAARRAPGLNDPRTDAGIDPVRSREAIELEQNYHRIADPETRRRVFHLVKAIAFAGRPEE